MKYIILFSVIFFPFLASAQDAINRSPGQSLQLGVEVEKNIGYNTGILREKLDYRLSSNNQGKFVIEFLTKPNSPMNVKIYDVIGNLIQDDNLTNDTDNQREYDFTERKTRIFVVKVESGRDNVIKKVNT